MEKRGKEEKRRRRKVEKEEKSMGGKEGRRRRWEEEGMEKEEERKHLICNHNYIYIFRRIYQLCSTKHAESSNCFHGILQANGA
jgi:hypothetical protein